MFFYVKRGDAGAVKVNTETLIERSIEIINTNCYR
jgi:hypothetical protein